MWVGTKTQINTQIQKEILFVRHGKTLSNEQKRYIGTTDEPLSVLGKEELLIKKAEIGAELAENSLLFCGPMKRCVETANLLFPEQRMMIIPEWTEINFGRFEGKNYEELKDDADYQAWLDSNGTIAFPQGESREAFIERCMKGYERMCQYVAEQGGTSKMVAVVHGGTIMALCSTLLEGNYFDYQVACGGTYRCII